MTDQWDPDDSRIAVGDPLHRTVTARVQGNVSSAIPPLMPGLPQDGFRSYPEPPDLEDDAGHGTVRGTREQVYSIVPTAPGHVALPATRLVWWDVNARRVRTAQAPGRSFDITGTAASAGAQQAPEKPPAAAAVPAPQTQQASKATPAAGARSPAAEPAPPAPAGIAWRYLLIALAVVALGIGLAIGWRHRPRHEERHDGARPPSRGAAWRDLKRACRGGDPVLVHRSLLGYLHAHYGVPPAEGVRRFRSAGHGAIVDAVNASLYGAGRGERLDTGAVLAAVAELRRPGPRREASLPALYD